MDMKTPQEKKIYKKWYNANYVDLKEIIHEAYEANLSLIESLTKERDVSIAIANGRGTRLEKIQSDTAKQIFAEFDKLGGAGLWKCDQCENYLDECEHYQAIKAKYLKQLKLMSD